MKIGDLVRVVRYHFGNDQKQEIGIIIGHYVSQGGFDVWRVAAKNDGASPGSYNTRELRVINESR